MICRQCQQPFTVFPDETELHQSFGLPAPTLCPVCRLQGRLAFRNERSLYNRTCDLCHQPIVSIHKGTAPYPVYCQPCWWSDQYDAMASGQPFDFSKTFTEQFKQLQLAVPHAALYQTNATNSTYNNYVLNISDCYLLFGGGNNEHCLYGKYIIDCKDVLDVYSSIQNELGYELVGSDHCYNCRYADFSRNCRDCAFIAECLACSDCIMCYGLQHKQYYYQNKYVGPEKFAVLKDQYDHLTAAGWENAVQEFKDFRKTFPQRASHIYASEDCTGDLISNSVDCHECFDIKESEHCRYVSYIPLAKDSVDCTFGAPYGVEHCYNLCSATGNKNCHNAFLIWNSYDVAYSTECHLSHDLFGCAGLRKQQYCILNKQYNPAEYQALKEKIITHMTTTGEWGEYLSPEYVTL